MSTSAARLPVERTDVSTCDRGEANELIEQMYVGHRPRTGPHRPDTELTVRSAAAGELTADRVRMTISLDTGTEAFGDLLSYRILSGSIRVDDGTEDVRLKPGNTVLYQLGVPLRVQSDGLELAMLRLPFGRAAALAEQRTGIEPHELRFESMTPVSVAMRRYFNSVIGLVQHELLADGSATSNPLVHEQMVQTAAAAVLASFPNTTMTVNHLSGPGWVPPTALRRATAYIDAHAADPITVTDVAHAAGVGARALQSAFRRHHETTPTGYLRRVRLARAHGELVAADPTGGETAAAVAARWGFTKPGRFVTEYRQAYGQLPGETLRS